MPGPERRFNELLTTEQAMPCGSLGVGVFGFAVGVLGRAVGVSGSGVFELCELGVGVRRVRSVRDDRRVLVAVGPGCDSPSNKRANV